MSSRKEETSKFSNFSFYKEKKQNELDRLTGQKKQSKGLFSLFSSAETDDNTDYDIESVVAPNGTDENTTLMSSIKAAVSKRALGMKETINNTVDTGRNLKYFMIFLLTGCFLIFLSLLFLPVVVISPHKFACLFTLGSGCIFLGLAYYHGLSNFVKKCDMIRVVYAISLVFTLYSAVFIGSYLLTMACSIIQFFAMMFFL